MRGLTRLIPLTVLVVLFIPGAATSPLGADAHVVASEQPGGYDYVLGATVADVAGTLTFVNLDLRSHDVVAVADGPETNSWCPRYANRDCPLFASPLIGLGEQADVEGIDQLTPLASYEYYCTIHPWMRGTVTMI